MSKRKAEDVPSLQNSLALQAALESPEGFVNALKILNDSSNESLRTRLKEAGYVVAKKDKVEKLIQDAQLLESRAENTPNDDQKVTFIKEVKDTIAGYARIGIDMGMAEKRRRFEGACVSNSRYGYSSNSRYNLEDGMCHVPDQDMHNPYKKAEESWHTYYAGPKACDWAKEVLGALNVPEDKFYVHKGQRVVSVEWRARLGVAEVVDSDEED